MADAQPSSALARAIAEEQSFVETAYQALDEKREYYSEQLRSVRAQGAFGSPGQRSERDSFAYADSDPHTECDPDTECDAHAHAD